MKKIVAVSASFLLLTTVSAQTIEKVTEADAEPQNAELTLNPEYKDKAEKINETAILDNESLPVAKDEYNTENNTEIIENSEITEIAKESETSQNETVQKPLISNEETIVVDKTEDNFDNSIAQTSDSEDEILKDDKKEEIIASREISMKISQFLEVKYPGKGWSYLGDDESKNLLSFMGRKLSKEDTNFTLKSKKAGTVLLHFYKNDVLTGLYIDDYLSVTILDEVAKDSEKNQKISAPLYAEVVPSRPSRGRENSIVENEKIETDSQISKGTEKIVKNTKSKSEDLENDSITSLKDEKIKTNIQTTKTEVSSSKGFITQNSNKKINETESNEVQVEENNNIDIRDFLNQAKKAFEEKKYTEALSFAQQYLDISINDTDEVLYLLGQIWESESQVRNIKSSIDSYNALVKNYPTSNLWRKANQRLVYLRRFYVEIR